MKRLVRWSALRRRLDAAIGLLTGLYACGLIAFVGWQLWLPREFAPLALAAAFLPFVFAPLLLTVPLAWAARARVSLALHGVALGLFVALYGPRFVPPPLRVRPPQAHEQAVTVLTHNLHYLAHDADELATALLAQPADLLAVQELAPSAEGHLAAALSERYPHQVSDGWHSDVALYARYPIIDHEWRTLAHKPGGALLTTVAMPGGAWRVIVVHPYSPRTVRFLGMSLPLGVSYRDLEHDLAALLDEQLAAGLPVVLLGDLNASEQSLAYRAARARLRDAHARAGWGLGFTFPRGGSLRGQPIPCAIVRIDYVLYSAPLRATRARVFCGDVSDHCALLAELAAPR
ncbi:MAG: endonuclease/exonuclease/phosphatase family protein [Anaerolineae bacterium]|jgi:endonuclease/exonuclease/phosphatase (EEP) superfamily protein YafD